MPIEMSFGVVEASLARLYGIASGRRTAFQARLKNFLKLGFPQNIAAGRGRAGVYSPAKFLQMVLAMEFSQCGLPPSIIVPIIESNWYRILPAAVRALMKDEFIESCESPWPDSRIFFVARPEALRDLMSEEADISPHRDAIEALHLSELQEFIGAPRTHFGNEGRAIILDIRYSVFMSFLALKEQLPTLDFMDFWEDLYLASEASPEHNRITLKKLSRQNDIDPQA